MVKTILQLLSEKYGLKCDVEDKFNTGNYGDSFKLSCNNEIFVLKIVPKENEDELIKQLAFLHFLNQGNVLIPNPINSCTGDLYIECTYRNNPSFCYIYPFLTGENVEDSIEIHIKNGNMITLGKEVGKLHKVMNQYPVELMDNFKNWDDTDGLMVINGNVDSNIQKEIMDLYKYYFDKLKRMNISVTHVVHNDLHMANIIYLEENHQFKFIDFDECVRGNRMMDVAIILFDLPVICSNPELYEKGIVDILKGYEKVYIISEEEKKAIQIMLKLLEISCYINFYKYRNELDPWLQGFYKNRLKLLIENKPYIGFDF